MNIVHALVATTASILLTNCGQNITETESKSYTLAVLDSDPSTNAQFQLLIDEFNQFSGFEALHFSNNTSDADSLITLTPGLYQRDGKIGWGQWILTTGQVNSVKSFGLQRDIKYDYSMGIELDQDYVLERLIHPEDKEKHYDLQKLFFHEIGHGLKMPHAKEPTNLMYKSVSGQKDFVGFFKRVGEFFGRS